MQRDLEFHLIFLALLLGLGGVRLAHWAGAIIATAAVGASWYAARDELAVARIRSASEFTAPGLFRWVRHPIEVVLATLAVGLTLLSGNWIVALLAGALAVHGVARRAPRVDRERRARLGSAYDDYARTTPAFVPRLSARSRTRDDDRAA